MRIQVTFIADIEDDGTHPANTISDLIRSSEKITKASVVHLFAETDRGWCFVPDTAGGHWPTSAVWSYGLRHLGESE